MEPRLDACSKCYKTARIKRRKAGICSKCYTRRDTQRTIAKAIGVGQATIGRDLQPESYASKQPESSVEKPEPEANASPAEYLA